MGPAALATNCCPWAWSTAFIGAEPVGNSHCATADAVWSLGALATDLLSTWHAATACWSANNILWGPALTAAAFSSVRCTVVRSAVNAAAAAAVGSQQVITQAPLQGNVCTWLCACSHLLQTQGDT
eukprot:1157469-Pelagomonas_calceolata.AAC.9